LVRPSRESFAKNLEALMIERGLSDVGLGRLIGRTGAAVGRWRVGQTEPSFEDKDAVAKALKVPVSRLYEDPTDDRSTGLPWEKASRMIAAALKKAQETKD